MSNRWKYDLSKRRRKEWLVILKEGGKWSSCVGRELLKLRKLLKWFFVSLSVCFLQQETLVIKRCLYNSRPLRWKSCGPILEIQVPDTVHMLPKVFTQQNPLCLLSVDVLHGGCKCTFTACWQEKEICLTLVSFSCWSCSVATAQRIAGRCTEHLHSAVSAEEEKVDQQGFQSPNQP